jgi:hypothetical protein
MKFRIVSNGKWFVLQYQVFGLFWTDYIERGGAKGGCYFDTLEKAKAAKMEEESGQGPYVVVG